MRSLIGIDLSTSGNKTWAAIGIPSGARLSILSVAKAPASAIPSMQFEVMAIDVPLGWPSSFRQAIGKHRAGSPCSLPEFPERATDRHVYSVLKGQCRNPKPLSVAADKIGRTAWSAASILSGISARINPTDQVSERPVVIEAYPKATLAILTGENFYTLERYKGDKATARDLRREIVGILERWVNWSTYRDTAVDCDDALDAVLALLTASAYAQAEVVPPPLETRALAAEEGWIYLPTDKFASPQIL